MKNISWERNYRKYKRYNKWPFDCIISLTKKHFKNSKNLKALDLGTGGGNNSIFLQAEKFNVFGIDKSKTSIKLTKKVVKKKFHNQIIRANFKTMPFKNSFFDLIIDRMSLSHNSEQDVKYIVNEIKRVMKNNSIFITSFHSNKNPNLKHGKKKGYTYNNFNKGTFLYSDIVFAPSVKVFKKIFNGFEILDFKENIIKDVGNNKILDSNFSVVLKKKNNKKLKK